MALFRARFLADDIYQITGEALQRRGIRLLLADLDNTLAPYGAPVPDERLQGVAGRAGGTWGNAVHPVQQPPSPAGRRIFAEALDVPYHRPCGKTKDRFLLQGHGADEGGAGSRRPSWGIRSSRISWGAAGRGWPPCWWSPIRLAGNPGRYLRYAVEVALPAAVPRGRRIVSGIRTAREVRPEGSGEPMSARFGPAGNAENFPIQILGGRPQVA